MQQVCAMGTSVRTLFDATRSHGFEWVDPGGGRTPGLAATETGAVATLRLQSPSLRTGYMSLGMEKSYWSRAILPAHTWRKRRSNALICRSHALAQMLPQVAGGVHHHQTHRHFRHPSMPPLRVVILR